MYIFYSRYLLCNVQNVPVLKRKCSDFNLFTRALTKYLEQNKSTQLICMCSNMSKCDSSPYLRKNVDGYCFEEQHVMKAVRGEIWYYFCFCLISSVRCEGSLIRMICVLFQPTEKFVLYQLTFRMTAELLPMTAHSNTSTVIMLATASYI